MEYITSRQNPLVAKIRKLSTSRSARRDSGLFLAEGPKMLDEALRWGDKPDTVVYATGVSLPTLPSETRLVEVPPQLLEYLSQTQSPQGVVFLSAMRHGELPKTLTGSRYMVLDGVQDPGNVGTIWRTADAFGAEGLILLPGCADPWSGKVVRATMGACYRLPLWECQVAELMDAVKGQNLPLRGAALRDDAKDVKDFSWGKCAVVVGSEGKGISSQMLALCDQTVKIPMTPQCESLNAAVAASVLLWEMWASAPKA